MPPQLKDLLAGTSNAAMQQIGLLPFVFLMAVSLVGTFLASWLYLRFYSSRATGSQVYRAFPLLGLSITAIFVCIQFSLPLSLGLLGALSIVRFRTPIKEPEEIGFIMLVIAASIATATFKLAFVGILFAVAVVALLLQTRGRIFGSPRLDGTIVVTVPEAPGAARTTPSTLIELLQAPGAWRGSREPRAAGDFAGPVLRVPGHVAGSTRPAREPICRAAAPGIHVQHLLREARRAVIGWLRRWGAIAAAIIALIGLGLLLDAKEAFPLLRVAVHRTPALLPSTIILPREERRPGIPVVSLYVPNPSLWDLDTGILPNRLRHGRAWERQGFVSFFDGERLTFSGSVGVRIHGGGSRHTRNPQGFRLFFRKQYGLPSMPARVRLRRRPRLRAEAGHPPQRHAGLGERHALSPESTRWRMSLPGPSGTSRPPRGRCGSISTAFSRTSTSSPSTSTRATTSRRTSAIRALMDDENLNRLWDQVQAIKPMRMREVSQLVDIDNLTRWFIAVIFCGTHDAFQGPPAFRCWESRARRSPRFSRSPAIPG